MKKMKRNGGGVKRRKSKKIRHERRKVAEKCERNRRRKQRHVWQWRNIEKAYQSGGSIIMAAYRRKVST